MNRSRKWLITINNPLEKGFSHQVIKDRLGQFKSLVYYCMADEIGEEGTFHTHIYFALANASRFETVKERFDGGHFDIARGTSEDNRNYVFKLGKWLSDKKKETNIEESHEEYGEMPLERQGARNDLADLYDMIKSGMSNYEILEVEPKYMLSMDKIERARQIIKENKFKSTFRELEVTYIWGLTGSGKTRGVMEKYGYENVYRVTDYKNPFDGYAGQDVIVFEEFRSSIKIQDMLCYLDGYPVPLPCRYLNKAACFTKVYIITNIDLRQQYENVQAEYPETWEAFLRRLGCIKTYSAAGVDETRDIKGYCSRPAAKVYNLTPAEDKEIRTLFKGVIA